MTSQGDTTITRLSDSGRTISPPADDIRGRKVRDKDGQELGKVEDLLIDVEDNRGRVRFLLVEHGGFLGLGETKSLIPVEAITEVGPDHVVINHTGEHVAGAPPYRPELVSDRHYHHRIYDHYGTPPYGGPGAGTADPAAYFPRVIM